MSKFSFADCRDYGHAWAPYDVTIIEPDAANPHREYVRVLRCRTCHTLRHQHLDHAGYTLGNSYHYAEGYRVPGGVSAEEKVAMRLGNLKSWLRRPTLRAIADD